MTRLLGKLATIAAAVTLAGCYCGTWSYDEKVYQTWDEYALALHATPIELGPEGSGVNMQLPLIFMGSPAASSSQLGSAETTLKMVGIDTQNEVDLNRYFLPQVERADHSATYEMWIEADEEGKRWPVYCYVLMPGANAADAQSRATYREQLATAFTVQGVKPAWETKPLFEDTTMQAQLMTVTGNLPHAVRVAQARENSLLDSPGRLDLYLISQGAKSVVVGWRAPNALADPLNFFAAAEQAVRTLTFAEDAPTPTPGSGDSTTELAATDVGGTNLQMGLPEGWRTMSSGIGFTSADGRSSVKFTKYDRAYDDLIAGYTDAYLQSLNVVVKQKDEVQIDEKPATLWVWQQGGLEYWNLIFGDDTVSYNVTGTWSPPGDDAAKQYVRAALLSIKKK